MTIVSYRSHGHTVEIRCDSEPTAQQCVDALKSEGRRGIRVERMYKLVQAERD